MHKETFEVVTHAENALAYSNQAIAVLNMWMDTLQQTTTTKLIALPLYTVLCMKRYHTFKKLRR